MNALNTSIRFRGILAATILGATVAGLPAVGAAGDPSSVRTVTVGYSDLSVSSPEGAASLYRRIVWAARQVCEAPDDTLASREDSRACVNKAIADAVTKVGQPELAAVYNARNAQPPPARLASVGNR